MNSPQSFLVNGTALDRYLAEGWYRMGQHIFTTDSIFYKDEYYKAYWLRYNLSKFTLQKSHKALLQRNKNFTISLAPFTLTPAIKDLYEQYFQHITFDASATLQEVLYSCETNPDIHRIQYDSMQVAVYNDKELIAAGIYDNGLQSMAGICNFYLPSYKKYSLGKLLVLTKLHIALQQQKLYYYPGYIVPGIANFDYKTFVGTTCIEVWEATKKEWLPYEVFFK